MGSQGDLSRNLWFGGGRRGKGMPPEPGQTCSPTMSWAGSRHLKAVKGGLAMGRLHA